MQAARAGDWPSVEQLTAALGNRAIPQGPEDLLACLRMLKEILVVAKTSRAGMVASLNRLSAAASFQGNADI